MIFLKKKELNNNQEEYLVFKNRLIDIDHSSGVEEGILIIIGHSEPIFTARKVLVNLDELPSFYKKWERINDFTFPSSILGHFLHVQHENLDTFNGL